jgi:hypothetical protein
MTHGEDLDLDLPDGIHATVLRGRDPNGTMLAVPIVWADRITDRCDQCGEPIAKVVEGCPAVLDAEACAGGQLESTDLQHGCGNWLSVDWREADIDQVTAVAKEMAADRKREIDAEHERIERRLRRDLTAAMARLSEPLDAGETAEERADEVTTGSEIEPGIYHDADQWLAWDYDPASEGDTITVTADEVTT